MNKLNIISLGLGVQSTALYYMSSIGELPRADYAIFSDLGRESQGTYEYLEYLLDWQKQNNGIPIIVKNEKNLYAHLVSVKYNKNTCFTAIPAFTKNDDNSTGMLRRQCTSEYKISVVDNTIRDLYGLKPRQRRPKTNVWIGISLDELERISIPQQSWKHNIYPFIGYSIDAKGNNEKIDYGAKMTRANIHTWYAKNNLPVPPKSSCVFCPYQSDSRWNEMKTKYPADFEAAVMVDKSIRDATKMGIHNPIYLHNSLLPLDEVKFNIANELPWGDCSGNCHL